MRLYAPLIKSIIARINLLEFNVPEGTKGTFIETYNDQTKKGTEIEYLLQRDTEIIVTDIQWSNMQKKYKKWDV